MSSGHRPGDPGGMRKRLLFTIALGAALAIIAAGTATSVTVGELQVDAPTDQVLPACSNLSDDDGDGAVDLGDPGCSSPLDSDEYNAPEPPPSTGGGSGSSGGGSGSSGGGTTTTAPGTTTTTAPKSGSELKGAGRREGDLRRPAQAGEGDEGAREGGAPEDLPARAPKPGRLPRQDQPRAHDRLLRPRPDRGPEPGDRLVRDPALPAFDLSVLRDRVRDPLAGARLDQQDRDRLRDEPERLLRRGDGLDAVHPLDLGRLRDRRERGRDQGPLQPARCDLRRRPLPPRRRRRRGPPDRDLRLQPRRLVRR